MSVRPEVRDFVRLGALPASSVSEDVIREYQTRLERITPPVSKEEGVLLLGCFGPDDCYGLAWTLLHLIESAPGGAALATPPGSDANEWLRRLWKRAHGI